MPQRKLNPRLVRRKGLSPKDMMRSGFPLISFGEILKEPTYSNFIDYVMRQIKFNAKAAVAVAVALVSFVGFNSFKKADPNLYKLVGGEYRMVDQNSGTCQPTTPETCLWEIESNELTIPVSENPSKQPYEQGEFDGNFATAP